MNIRPLTDDDRPALHSMLMREPSYNLFALSALAENTQLAHSEAEAGPWAIGVFRSGDITGMLMSVRGTAGLYYALDDPEALPALSKVVTAKTTSGAISLLSGHASQLDPLLPTIRGSSVGIDRCFFQTLTPADLTLPSHLQAPVPRLAGWDDMERVIDFYMVGFYSLARLPSRAAWHKRLSEQLAYRTLYVIEDEQGRVIAAALSSAEGGGAAMLGGVATLPEHRGQGLSSLCVGALCAHLFRKGLGRIALFFLQDNQPAARVYKKLGFQDAGEWLLVPLGSWFA